MFKQVWYENEEGMKWKLLTGKANFVQGMKTNHIIWYDWFLISIYIVLIMYTLSMDPVKWQFKTIANWERQGVCVCPGVGCERAMGSVPYWEITDDS